MPSGLATTEGIEPRSLSERQPPVGLSAFALGQKSDTGLTPSQLPCLAHVEGSGLSAFALGQKSDTGLTPSNFRA